MVLRRGLWNRFWDCTLRGVPQLHEVREWLPGDDPVYLVIELIEVTADRIRMRDLRDPENELFLTRVPE